MDTGDGESFRWFRFCPGRELVGNIASRGSGWLIVGKHNGSRARSRPRKLAGKSGGERGPRKQVRSSLCRTLKEEARYLPPFKLFYRVKCL